MDGSDSTSEPTGFQPDWWTDPQEYCGPTVSVDPVVTVTSVANPRRVRND